MYRTRGLKIIRARIFNLLGPGQPEHLVPMTFIRQLRNCRAGEADRLKVGNLDTRRDFVDVRDVAAAFEALLDRGEGGQAYNVGSGTDVSIREVIESVFRLAGFSVPLETDPSRFRRADVPCVRADVTKISASTGWRARISLDESLQTMWG